jgi:hypothetical protein
MTIKFVCTCGKRLRARDEMAARRSFCPRCGAPIGIPSQQPTHTGTAATPLTPAQRVRLASQRLQPPAAPPEPVPAPYSPPDLSVSVTKQHSPTPLAPDAVRAVLPEKTRPPSRRQRELEVHWYHCLAYPFRAWPLVLGHALLLSLMTVVAVKLLPEGIATAPWPAWIWAFLALAPLQLVAHACGFLHCTLTAGAVGESWNIRWPGLNLALATRALVVWLVCFLAGPVVLVAAGYWYWLNGGDLTGLDQLVLAELGTVALGWWLLALTAVSERDRLRDANPARVVEMAERLGYRWLIAVLFAAVWAGVHGLWALAAAEAVHDDVALGWLSLLGCWASVMIGTTFLFRLLGVWCFHSRPASGK